ncbi:DNA N-6-adenine-methyltransferase [Listeria goaensis]|uniref:DNA N-6-adenine-methyltransferase n=1 Tax=Listeria goaensis TaxID=1649188 RepID=UPI0019682871|nr:DNA N-6-adenine-methyltransferase [Listeria goaensis]
MKTELHFSSKNHIWETPPALFDELNREFQFTLDAAADANNHKCDVWFSEENDALNQKWRGSVFCNPPYEKELSKFIEKAYVESKQDYNKQVVLLIPVFPYAEIRFLKGRVKFELKGGNRMNQSELDEKIRLHEMWLNDQYEGDMLRVSSTNLVGLDLSYSNLTGAFLPCANLSFSNLTGANLRSTDLRDAKLTTNSLTNADLSYSNLSGANLSFADLSYSNLTGANLTGANLTGANLNHCNWQDMRGLSVIAVQVDTTRRNNQITYIPKLGIVTTGCFQGTLAELKARVKITHANNAELLLKYNRIIAFFEEEVE